MLDGNLLDENASDARPMAEIVFQLADNHLPQILADRKSTVVRKQTQNGTVHLKSYVLIDFQTIDEPQFQETFVQKPQNIVDAEIQHKKTTAVIENTSDVLVKHSGPKIVNAIPLISTSPSNSTRKVSIGPSDRHLKVSQPKLSQQIDAEQETYLDAKKTTPIKVKQFDNLKTETSPNLSHLNQTEIVPTVKKSVPPQKNGRLLSSIKDKPFYHEICKREEEQFQNVNCSKNRSKSLNRSASSAKISQLYYDKHPDLWVKQYRRIADLTRTTSASSDQVGLCLRSKSTTQLIENRSNEASVADLYGVCPQVGTKGFK